MEFIFSKILMESYIESFRNVDKFMECCKVCPNYDKRWSCPPYDFSTTDMLSKYKYVHIIGAKIPIEDRLKFETVEEFTAAIKSLLVGYRNIIDAQMLELESQNSGSLAFFGGSCVMCGDSKCQRAEGKKCINPSKVRYSLESVGFDVTRTSEELLGLKIVWGENLTLPPYYVLISSLATNNETVNLSMFE